MHVRFTHYSWFQTFSFDFTSNFHIIIITWLSNVYVRSGSKLRAVLLSDFNCHVMLLALNVDLSNQVIYRCRNFVSRNSAITKPFPLLNVPNNPISILQRKLTSH